MFVTLVRRAHFDDEQDNVHHQADECYADADRQHQFGDDEAATGPGGIHMRRHPARHGDGCKARGHDDARLNENR